MKYIYYLTNWRIKSTNYLTTVSVVTEEICGKKIQGFQTGTDCGPWMANLYLVYYELKFIHSKLKNWNRISRGLQIILLNYYRDIDDIFDTVGNDLECQDVLYFEGNLD